MLVIIVSARLDKLEPFSTASVLQAAVLALPVHMALVLLNCMSNDVYTRSEDRPDFSGPTRSGSRPLRPVVYYQIYGACPAGPGFGPTCNCSLTFLSSSWSETWATSSVVYAYDVALFNMH